MNIALGIFRALADSTRLRILALLRSMELSVGELAQVLGQSQPRVSRHVKILCDAGLAERRKEGSWVFVALGKPAKVGPVFAALDAWAASPITGRWPTRPGSLRCARIVRRRRRNGSRRMPATGMRSGRSTLPKSEVEAAMAEALGDAPLGRLIDIGTGTGRMLELFAACGRARAGDRPLVRNASARARQARRSADSPTPSYARPISTRCR